MAWRKVEANGYLVAEETVVLGGTATTRYTSQIDFINPSHDFWIISNSVPTNTSGSLHDEVHVAYQSGGTFYSLKTKLRSSSQGTSFDSLDNATRVRFWDASVDGSFPYFKVGIKHNAVESTGKTIKVIIVYDRNNQ